VRRTRAFYVDTHALLGVHIIGEGASELVHIGQAVLAFNGPIEYFVNTVSIIHRWRSATKPPPLTVSIAWDRRRWNPGRFQVWPPHDV
jgi:hypothetical protein